MRLFSIRIVIFIFVLALVSSCKHLAKQTSLECQARIDECLKHCGETDLDQEERMQRQLLSPWDNRSWCERNCHWSCY